LPDRLRKVLFMRFVEERKQADIAAEIGVSQVHVSRLLQQAMRKLRELRDAQEAVA
jgi:RNA polymerase sigma factor (sigma-70 family)